ncbi:carbohydrate ABC transporter permease [Paenibacillus aestuarii]|uniref:Carbohydrate ABC transporter permease n=1 Tax=Paenibacillus aestuarii TaxID=516965 RepID=A0ABW0K7E0_9BACL|nr:sugar ABC transporter permease [Paenibacillus aestuarii]
MEETIQRVKGTRKQGHTVPRFTISYYYKRYLFIYGCLLLPILFFITVRIIPMLYAFNISFRQWDMLSENKPFVGLANYQALFEDTVFLTALTNTAVYVVLGVIGQLSVGMAIALLVRRVAVLRGFYRAAYFLPYITSVVAVSWVFRWIFMKNGIVNAWLLAWGLDAQPFLYSTTQAIYLIAAVMVWQNIGFQMLIFVAGLDNIPAIYYDAASIDGAGRFRRWIHITIPLLNPVIVFSVVMATISYLQSFTQVLNMTGGGPLNSTISIVLHIYNSAFKSFNMGYASAGSAVLFVMILALVAIQLKLVERKVEY